MRTPNGAGFDAPEVLKCRKRSAARRVAGSGAFADNLRSRQNDFRGGGGGGGGGSLRFVSTSAAVVTPLLSRTA